MSLQPKERWATRIGLILAMAGNAVGLGNFLRFPVQAAANGGGTFMIPYFITFLILGIPLMWMEWTIGRFGGRQGHGTVPGMFDLMTDGKHSWAKYVGVIGVVFPFLTFIYYTYVVSWMLGFSFLSLTGGYFGLGDVGGMRDYVYSYQDVFDSSTHGPWITVLFFMVTMACLAAVLRRGVSRGIEKLALIGMPILFLFAIVLLIRVLTLPRAMASPIDGLNFIWNPDWAGLLNARVWLAAAGQMFFTLSLGVGTIHTYASFLRKEDDITLAGLSTATTNEFAEVVLGGTIAIPAAIVFFGVGETLAIARDGTYDLAIVAMGGVFPALPGPQLTSQIFGLLWFALLFIAGITSSVALASPAIAFLRDEFQMSRDRAVGIVMAVAAGVGLLHVAFYTRGFLAEWDYWIGTFGLVVFATIEVLLFSYFFGVDRGWKEMHEGAELRVPSIYKPVMKWVTPLFLVVILAWWSVTEAVPTLLMQTVADSETIPVRWASRTVMVAFLILGLYLVNRAWRNRPAAGTPEGAPS